MRAAAAPAQSAHRSSSTAGSPVATRIGCSARVECDAGSAPPRYASASTSTRPSPTARTRNVPSWCTPPSKPNNSAPSSSREHGDELAAQLTRRRDPRRRRGARCARADRPGVREGSRRPEAGRARRAPRLVAVAIDAHVPCRTHTPTGRGHAIDRNGGRPHIVRDGPTARYRGRSTRRRRRGRGGRNDGRFCPRVPWPDAARRGARRRIPRR